jgi:hypothetical protein
MTQRTHTEAVTPIATASWITPALAAARIVTRAMTRNRVLKA